MTAKSILTAIDRCAENGRRQLRLSGRGLKAVPEELCELTHLTKLEMWDNELENLPACFSALASLEHLDMQGNNFTEIPDPIFELAELRVLMFSGNRIRTVPGSIERLRNLTTLWLGTNVASIDPAIGQLENLQELRVLSRGPISLPAEIGQLRNLRILDLSGCALPEFPRWILELEGLEMLLLRECGLREVPEEINALTSLQVLGLSGNNLSSVPDSIFDLGALAGLFLDENPELEIIDIPLDRVPNLSEASQGRRLGDWFLGPGPTGGTEISVHENDAEPIVITALYFPPERCFIGVPYGDTGAPLKQSSEDRRWHDLEIQGAPSGARVRDLWMSDGRWIASMRVPAKDGDGGGVPLLAITSNFAKWTFVDLAPLVSGGESLSVSSVALSGQSVVAIAYRESKSQRPKGRDSPWADIRALEQVETAAGWTRRRH